MKKFATGLIASLIAISGASSPAQAFQLYPVQCQPTIDTVLYYSNGGQEIVGEEVTYCDGHVIFLGAPGTHSWTEYCGCS